MTMRLGAHVDADHTQFAVRSPDATDVWLCLFDGADETRHRMVRNGDVWTLSLEGDLRGQLYAYRAAGDWSPDQGRWFDPAKLLVDPYAQALDRSFVQHSSLAEWGSDTAGLVPRSIVPPPSQPVAAQAPYFERGGLIYEINIRAFTMLHPDVPMEQRGTVAALAHPAILAHLKKLHVSAVELMPIVAWLDERHLPPLGLKNGWGYNPVSLMALDPRLCPGGVAELRDTVAALHAEGIGVILDLVFNHTGESDVAGGILSLRGLDNAAYAHAPRGVLINDTGCGNTLDFSNPAVRRLTIDALCHFVSACGIDGFRFDLATILARGQGFDASAPIFAEIAAERLLADRVMIAEPWDIGPGGYQLGHFPENWLEWNDRFRDDVRKFWRGDGDIGTLATRLAGSSDYFQGRDSRSVNFIAAHDGFSLADMLAYANRSNWANGEQNRDGHHENFSWNHGVEGTSDDPGIQAARGADARALLGTLFASTGTIMLMAGDEFGRSQKGNNNAYAQDNPLTWLDWEGRDLALEDHVAALAAWRAERVGWFARFPEQGVWLGRHGPLEVADWEAVGADVLIYHSHDSAAPYRFAIDRASRSVILSDVQA